MKARFFFTATIAFLTIGLFFASSEISAQSSTRRGSSESVSGNSGRNYRDHINNINVGNNDRPSGNKSNNKPDNKSVNKPDTKPNTNNPGGKVIPDNNKPDNKKPGNNINPNNNDRYNGNRSSSNPPKVTNNPPKKKANPPKGTNRYTPPRYNRNDPNRYLGYNPFKDGRVIHRPEPYHSSFDLGIRFSTRPSSSIKIRFGGLTLYFSNGVWYNYEKGYYTVYRPPVGTVIPYSSISTNLYYVDFEVAMDYNNVYYVDSYANFYTPVRNFRTYGNTYNSLEVVDAPVGAILYDLPSDYREIVYNGSIYYVIGNSVFEYVYSTSNSWYFRCVGLYK